MFNKSTPAFIAILTLCGCAEMLGIARLVEPAACVAVASVFDESGQEIARGLCPAIASELGSSACDPATTVKDIAFVRAAREVLRSVLARIGR